MRRAYPGDWLWLAVPMTLVLIAIACYQLTRHDVAAPVDERSMAATSPARQPAPLRLLMTSTAAFVPSTHDQLEVWVCDVPAHTSDPAYYRTAERLDLDPGQLAATLEKSVPSYFEALSHGAYSPVFVPGDTYMMAPTDSPQDCLNAALDASGPTSNAVLAIATAEHASSVSGGFGTPGAGCTTTDARSSPCRASLTRRGAYVGASDFHPDWGGRPPMDLVEHEIGHTLGWPHSGSDSDGYASGLDVMSNSAAPRELNHSARDAQGTLAINELAAGWLSPSDVLIAEPGTAQFVLQPSNTARGPRLLVLPVDAHRLLTVEYLTATGLDAHLPRSGVTITLIDQDPSACGELRRTPCVLDLRVQRTLVGPPPFYDLLGTESTQWQGFGWSVQVSSLGRVGVTSMGAGLSG